MTRQTRYNIEVAVAVLIGVAALIGFVLYLRGVYSAAKTYAFSVDFKNARGVTVGAPVQMSGVQIGRVESVNLPAADTARLRLRIDGKYLIPGKSRFTIATGLLASTAIVNVDPTPGTPGTPIAENEEGLTGTDSANIDAAFAQGQSILTSTANITRALEKLVTNPESQRDLERTRRSLARTTENLARASESLPRLVRRVEQQEGLLAGQAQNLAVNLRAASASGPRIARNIEGLTSDLRGSLTENRTALREAAENIAGTTSAIRGLTEQINDEIKTGNLKQNLAATTENLRSISQRFDTIAANFERLSGDPRLTSDLRDIVTNARDASTSLRNVASRIETIRIPGERRPRPTGAPAPPPAPRPAPSTLLTEPGIVLDSVFDTDAEHVRLDANFTLLGADGRFFRAGIFDVTERNRLNLQLGQPVLGGRSALRYGLIRGKLGGGLDTRVGPLFVRADLYDLNRLTLDLRARARLSDTASALVGLESAGSDNRATVGVQISR